MQLQSVRQVFVVCGAGGRIVQGRQSPKAPLLFTSGAAGQHHLALLDEIQCRPWHIHCGVIALPTLPAPLVLVALFFPLSLRRQPRPSYMTPCTRRSMTATVSKDLGRIVDDLVIMIRRGKDSADKHQASMISQPWALNDAVVNLLGADNPHGFNPEMIATAERRLRHSLLTGFESGGKKPHDDAETMRANWFSWHSLLALSHWRKLVKSEDVKARDQRGTLVVNGIVDHLVPKVGAMAFLLYHWLASESQHTPRQTLSPDLLYQARDLYCGKSRI